MMDLKPKLKFKEVGVDANQKDQTRKLEDQKRWENYFQEIVVYFFANYYLNSFHEEFDVKKDQLDVFVPSYGNFICGQRNPGKRKGKSKVKIEDCNPQQQSGCGRRWNSYLTMTKFACVVNGNDLVVEVRQFGQRCERCSKENSPYENPSFKDKIVEEMIKFLLSAILDGMFHHTDPYLYINFAVLDGPPRFRRHRYGKKQANNDDKKTSNDNASGNDGNATGADVTDNLSANVTRTHENKNCEACDKNKDCGTRRTRRRRRKNKKAEYKYPKL